jgi:RNA polymerase sigma factor (sigma-70 family)
MAERKRKGALHRIHILEQVRALRDKDDRALLIQFVEGQEAPFEVLVQRHGPMVLGVCRRILGDGHDAEDAFQATFLLLARRAATIRNPAAVAAWLHAVACQVADRARKERERRNRVQVLTEADLGRTDPDPAVEWAELRPVLDEELGRLPEKYRAPLILCYLEDRSNAEAAEQLGWPIGTVKGRLARARSLLQSRLARRGVALGAGLFVAGSLPGAAEAVPPSLGALTTQHALEVAAGTTTGLTPAVAALYTGGLYAMSFGRIKVLAALAALLGICSFSGVFAYSGLGGLTAPPSVRSALKRLPITPFTIPEGRRKEVGSTEPFGAGVAARLVGAKESYPLDLGGKSEKEFRKQIDDIAAAPRRPGPGGPRFPASPKVDLKLQLTNIGKNDIKVEVGGSGNSLTLDLKGPGAFYAPVVVRNFLPVRREPTVVAVPAGKSVTIADLPTLGFPKPGTGSQAYWTQPGQYTLTVDYVLGVSPAPVNSADLGEGFGQVIVHSAPLNVKVVESN